ncbi:hypothetical protein CYMTET_37383 [Cymbomonas tetramitiformis]|uniref:EamA domain-containing protein n=1 Tax=Cymbomonas tetramitiformis TaxID=36881 RepID=A0AAE0CFK3_9CHLO|nr:hypothetical protein CYMTET_37383 [Cymbomonas tetramitiformis]
MGLELGTISGVAYCAQAYGLRSTSASQAAFLSGITVIVVPFLTGLAGKKISSTTWGACVLSITGVTMLESGGSPLTVGDAWILFSAFLFGLRIFRTAQHTRQLQNQEQRMQLTAMQLTVVALFAVFFGLAEHSSRLAVSSTDWSLSDVAGLLAGLPWPELMFTGLVSTSGCLWIEMDLLAYLYTSSYAVFGSQTRASGHLASKVVLCIEQLTALERVEAVDAAIIYTLEPLWGAGIAWVMLGERWGFEGWGGAALIMSGCLVAQLRAADLHMDDPLI